MAVRNHTRHICPRQLLGLGELTLKREFSELGKEALQPLVEFFSSIEEDLYWEIKLKVGYPYNRNFDDFRKGRIPYGFDVEFELEKILEALDKVTI